MITKFERAPTASALGDLRVLDLSLSVAGAWCSRLLADFGADVVMVEPPGGHPLRCLPPLGANGSGIPARYLQANKRAVSVDLGAAQGRRTVLDLACSSDLVIESFRPGVLDEHGLGFGVLEQERPGILLVSLTPYGQTGPRAFDAGNDLTAFAWSGWASINGRPQGPPLKAGGHFASYVVGAAAFGAAVLALVHRERGGGGQHIDVAETEVLLEMFAPGVLSGLHTGVEPRGGSLGLSSGAMLETRDGHFAFTLTRGHRWREALIALGLAELANDPRYDSESERLHADFIRAVRERASQLGKMEMFDLLESVRTAGGPVLSTAELAANLQLCARAFFVRLKDGDGETELPGAPFKMSRTPWRLRRAQPEPGGQVAELGAQWRRRHAPTEATAGIVARAGESTPSRVNGPVAEGPTAAPLADVRVLAFTHAWAGPFSTALLAFAGADVVQVEARSRPDEFRAGIFEGEVPPRLASVPTAIHSWNCQPQYNAVNLNKRSITLDLRDSAGRAIIERMIARADVVVENFSVRVKERLGLTYDALRKIRPDLVMLSISGYGQSGPWRDRLAGGGQIEATSGMSSLMGHPDAPMNWPRTIADPTAGYLGFAAVVTALYHRQRTGEGQYIDLAMEEALHTCVGDAMLEFFATGKVRERMANRHSAYAPHGVYPARGEDRWVAIAAESEEQWEALCRVACRPGWRDDQRFATVEARQANEDELDQAIAEWSLERDRDDLARELVQAGVTAAPVLTSIEVAYDHGFRARGVIVDVTHAETGTWPQVGVPYRLSRSPLQVTRPAPLHGEHSREVFAEWLGLDAASYLELEHRGVTGMGPPPDWVPPHRQETATTRERGSRST